MAFYEKAPSRKPRKARETEWEEEGTRYSDRKPSGKRFGPAKGTAAGKQQADKKPAGKRGDPERKPAVKRTAPDRKPGLHSDRRETDVTERKRPAQRRDPVREPKPERSYLDFEHSTGYVTEEEPTEARNENILAGRNPIREALKGGRDIEKLLVQKGELTGSARQIVQMAMEAHIPVQKVEKNRLDELAPNHQGLVAFASAYAYATVEDMLALAAERGEDPFLIILDGLTDPHNLGAIIRSAECAGAHGVIVRERRGVGLTPAAVKASAGAVEYVKVARVNNLNRLIEDIKRKGVWVYGLSMDGEDFEQVDFSGGVALVVGSEGSGISRLTADLCDRQVSLPLRGRLDSLNASVAAGIVMYRVLSVRRK